MEKRRQIALAVGVLSLAAIASDPPSADIQIMTHRIGDASPARFQMAADLGLASASILVTWTADRLTR
ncbi:hypothetical protein [Sphingomonas radiodurans]|uniref:hypothetical protein n=1 Tax=Sphingomonas radiodurans TaxID=2890321 RepID=UPI001E40B4FA|nr:hypothetical protein [Sphingomonas radiodurans]WBH15779.1 hypothetical protein LLW23_13270 [Sphingomonas radiodurans]